MRVPFVKMHGCGNDFVVFDERAGPLGLTPARAAALSDRRTGIGCDQFIVLEPAPADSDAAAFMRIRNPDGGEAGACGNATRCVADLLARETGKTFLSVRTVAGDLACAVLADGRIDVDMGPARTDWRDVPLSHAMDTLHVPLGDGRTGGDAACVSIGNPHATFFVDDPETIDLLAVGPLLETDRIFPDRANIGFARVFGTGKIRLRLWERGAGLTLACGSGACAALVNAHRRGLIGRRATVIVDGGALDIVWGDDGRVHMSGPATTSFSGMVELDDFPA